MHKKTLAQIGLIFILFGFFSITCVAQANIVPDPSFERGTANWQLGDYASSIVSAPTRTGSKALKLINDFDGSVAPSHNAGQYRINGIVGGREYVYKVWVRGNNVTGIGAGGKPLVVVRWRNAAQQKIREEMYNWAPYGTYNWREMKLHMQAPSAATGVDVSFRSWWDCTGGQTYWDDVSLAPRDFGSRGSMLATYQAENANIRSGGSIRSTEPDYTGSGYFDVSSDGAILQWNNVSGGGNRILAARYTWEGNVRYLELFVNGVSRGRKTPVMTGRRSSWASELWNVNLPAGSNTVRLKIGQAGHELAAQPMIDRLEVFSTGGVIIADDLKYMPVAPCRIVDTRRSGGIINAGAQRNFRVYGSVGGQGGDYAGCPSPGGEPYAAHINMVAVDPTGKGNLKAFPVGAGTGAGLSVNYNTIDTNLANAGSVKTVTGSGADITVASSFSAAHAVIDVLGYYYRDEGFYYTPVDPCRIVDTRNTSAGILDANTQRNFDVFGSVGDQGGDPFCPSTLGVDPAAAHINMVAVDPAGKGNLQAFPVGAGAGAGLSVNYNTIDTNLANAGTVKAVTGSGRDITVASNFSSAHSVIDVLGYYSNEKDLLYTPVTPCRVVDTRKTSAGIIDANTQRNFSVYGSVGGQGGNPAGCSSPGGQPLAAHINMVAVDPAGKGNLQAFPVGAGTGAGLSVNYNTIDTNLANAGTIRTVTGSGADFTVASNFSSAHTVIDVLGYYYSAP